MKMQVIYPSMPVQTLTLNHRSYEGVIWAWDSQWYSLNVSSSHEVSYHSKLWNSEYSLDTFPIDSEHDFEYFYSQLGLDHVQYTCSYPLYFLPHLQDKWSLRGGVWYRSWYRSKYRIECEALWNGGLWTIQVIKIHIVTTLTISSLRFNIVLSEFQENSEECLLATLLTAFFFVPQHHAHRTLINELNNWYCDR